MFLIRMAFWLALFVLLLPTDERQQAKLYGTATAAVERVTTFCDRNAKACAAGADLWWTFVKKAEFGARLAADLISRRVAGEEGAGPVAPAADKPSPQSGSPSSARNTLTPADLRPSWRGEAQRASY
jgi:hypothetical protein